MGRRRRIRIILVQSGDTVGGGTFASQQHALSPQIPADKCDGHVRVGGIGALAGCRCDAVGDIFEACAVRAGSCHAERGFMVGQYNAVSFRSQPPCERPPQPGAETTAETSLPEGATCSKRSWTVHDALSGTTHRSLRRKAI